MFEKLINFMMYLPKAIIEWLNINDAKVLLLPYFAFGILIVETILEVFISDRLTQRNGLYKIARCFLLNFIKYIPTLLIIVFCDPFVRQYLPSDMRVDLNNGLGKEIAETFVSLFIFEFALLLVSTLHNLLWFSHAGINLLIKGESKSFRIRDGHYDSDSKAVVAIILTQVQSIMVMIAFMLNAVVLYYNYLL